MEKIGWSKIVVIKKEEKVIFLITALATFLFMASITQGSSAPLEIAFRFISSSLSSLR
ncbi:MAG: hypothetical protein IPK68_16555 [Bdellovibrionales bacterium]|nr:hypothetical protein [Bdellovibrionales bacterium]